MGSVLGGLRRERLTTRKYSRNIYVTFRNDSLFIVIPTCFIGNTRYTNKCTFAGIFLGAGKILCELEGISVIKEPSAQAKRTRVQIPRTQETLGGCGGLV